MFRIIDLEKLWMWKKVKKEFGHKNTDSILLAENPHLVIQGEGPNISKKMILLRTLGCSIRCNSCDSKQTWDKVENRYEFEVEDLLKNLSSMSESFNIKNILLTGGEPGLYRNQFLTMFQLLYPGYCWNWDIETTGVYRFDLFKSYWGRIQFNISPKIGCMKPKGKHFDWVLLGDPKPSNYIVKIVVSKETFNDDLNSIRELQEKYNIPDLKIYLMPLGNKRKEIIKQSSFILDQCIKLGFEFSPRLHTLIWDNKKLV